MAHKPQKQSGFTLLELIIIIAAVVILVVVIISLR
jgi:Tfp pilus assembly protein PilE